MTWRKTKAERVFILVPEINRHPSVVHWPSLRASLKQQPAWYGNLDQRVCSYHSRGASSQNTKEETKRSASAKLPNDPREESVPNNYSVQQLTVHFHFKVVQSFRLLYVRQLPNEKKSDFWCNLMPAAHSYTFVKDKGLEFATTTTTTTWTELIRQITSLYLSKSSCAWEGGMVSSYVPRDENNPPIDCDRGHARPHRHSVGFSQWQRWCLSDLSKHICPSTCDANVCSTGHGRFTTSEEVNVFDRGLMNHEVFRR